MAETGKPDPIMGYKLKTDLRIGSIKAARNLQAVGEERKESKEYMRGQAYARGDY